MTEVFQLELSNGTTHIYQLKQSKRAKHIRIRLSPAGDLSVIVPSRATQRQAHSFVKSKSLWIEKHLSNLPVVESKTVPPAINLQLLNETWKVNTGTTSQKLPTIKFDEENLILFFSGSQLQTDSFYGLLAAWLKKKSKKTFNAMMEEIAEEFGFHYNKLSIRAQKTRWGSCSSGKNISLNCKLLFMPKKVVEYVMIHELCHTIQMNHSQKFWDLVEDCDPEFKAHRKQLKSFDLF